MKDQEDWRSPGAVARESSGFRPSEKTGPDGGFRPNRRRAAYYVAASMCATALFGASPALGYLNLSQAPGWARAALLLAALQCVYGAWIALLPDWSTLRAAMAAFAVVAALYGAAAAIVLATPFTEPLPLGLDAVRRSAAGWCGANVLLAGLITYVCGRTSSRWRAESMHRR